MYDFVDAAHGEAECNDHDEAHASIYALQYDVSPATDPKVLHSRTFQNMKDGSVTGEE